MTTKSTKSKTVDAKEACVHLETLNEVSYSLQALCYCKARDLVLGKGAVVCSVCELFKKSDSELGELYIADASEDATLWDDAESFYEVIKEEEGDEEEEDEEEDMPKKRRTRKKKVVEEEEEDDDDEEEKKKKAAEEEKVSEELFGGKEKEEEEPVVEDLEKEIHEAYDRKERKLAKAREKGIEVVSDDDLDLIDEFDDEEIETELKSRKKKKKTASKSTGSLPEVTIEITKDGKQRCPYCKKEFAAVARHVTRCKYSPGPEGVEAVKQAAAKLKK
jgi:hypothetical protein